MGAHDRGGGLIPRMATVGRLVPTITHEVNNPLTALIGRTQLLLAKKTLGPEEVGSGLDSIKTSALQVSEKVSLLGAWAREALSPPDPTPCLVQDAVREVHNLLATVCKKRGLVVSQEMPPLPPVLLRPIDLKLLLASMVLAACEGHTRPLYLTFTGSVEKDKVNLLVRTLGSLASSLPLFPEFWPLAEEASLSGLTVAVGDEVRFSMPRATQGPVG